MGLGKLKVSKLPIIVAEASDLPLGTVGEFITADTLKPYLDAIATKATPVQIATAISALETKILGGVGIDADTLSELNAKVGALQNLTDADKTGILNILATCVKSVDIMPLLDAKADEQQTTAALDDRYTKQEVNIIAGAKADGQGMATELANRYVKSEVDGKLNLKANVADVYNKTQIDSIAGGKASSEALEQRISDVQGEIANASTSLQNQISTKISASQAETIATEIVNVLEAKILGGVGTDADTMKELNDKVIALQSLSSADLTGVMAAIASKIDKSQLYTKALQNDVGDGSTLSGFLSANEVSDSTPISSELVYWLMNSINTVLNSKVSNSTYSDKNAYYESKFGAKLDKAEFDSLFTKQADGKFYSTDKLRTLVSEKLVSSNFADNSKDFTDAHLNFDLQSDNFLKIVLTTEEDGSLVAMNLNSFINYLVSGGESVLAAALTSQAQLNTSLQARVDALEAMFETA